MTNNVFFDKNVKTQQQQNKKSTVIPSQLRVSIVVKPYNFFYSMGQNVNKQSQICGPGIFNKYIFLY